MNSAENLKWISLNVIIYDQTKTINYLIASIF